MSSCSRTVYSHHLPCPSLWDSFGSTLKPPKPSDCCLAHLWTVGTLWSWCSYSRSSEPTYILGLPSCTSVELLGNNFSNVGRIFGHHLCYIINQTPNRAPLLSQDFIGALGKNRSVRFPCIPLVLKELILQTLEQGQKEDWVTDSKSLLPYTHWDIILNLYSRGSPFPYNEFSPFKSFYSLPNICLVN